MTPPLCNMGLVNDSLTELAQAKRDMGRIRLQALAVNQTNSGLVYEIVEMQIYQTRT